MCVKQFETDRSVANGMKIMPVDDDPMTAQDFPEVAARPGDADRPQRRRLPAAQRVTQILDAALRVFSDKGFAAARIDDIAEAAGLSKGGVYTHFASKEVIFGALLSRQLQPDLPAPLPDGEPVTVDVLVRQVIAPMYEAFGDPLFMLTMRLLLAEGMRAAQVVEDWKQAMFEPYLADVERLVLRGVRQGTLRRSVVTRAPRLLLSPGMHAMLDGVVAGLPDPAFMQGQQRLHVAMLRELLTP